MWRLISTWDRSDGSVSRRYPWSRGGARSLAARPAGLDLGTRAAAALAPIVAAHAIDVRAQPHGDSVVWCSRAHVFGEDQDDGDPGWCTDLWVHLDRSARTIAVDLEGHGLAEHVTGRTHWDGPVAIDLADDLDEALAMIAGHLDALCDAVVSTT